MKRKNEAEPPQAQAPSFRLADPTRELRNPSPYEEKRMQNIARNQDDCIKNELSLDEDDGPIPELVDDQESDDEETDSSMPELVHLDAIEDDEEVLGPIRLVSREVLDNHIT